MLSSIVFVNNKGEILINKAFKDDIVRSEVQNYCSKVIATKQYRENPILLVDGISYICVPYNDIILLATTKKNINCAMILEYLYKLIKICNQYFIKGLIETQIRQNFDVIYEILDETMDYGCPQYTETSILKTYILNKDVDNSNYLQNKKKEELRQMTQVITGNVGWREKDVFYKKNQVYIDVIEDINALFSAKGTVLRSDVSGAIKIVSKLSGMPQVKVGINDKLSLAGKQGEKQKGNQNQKEKGITIDDMKFHQCVRLPKFDKERSITFIPPDGVFQLMSYRVTQNVNLPFKIMPVYTEVNQTKVQIRVKMKSIFDKNLNANNVVIKIPCPKTTASVNVNPLVGRAKYEPQNGAIVWRIKKFQGDFECFLQCQVILSANLKDKPFVKPPIALQFSIPTFTASGLRVRFLKVHEKSGYKTQKFHKVITKSGAYEHRL